MLFLISFTLLFIPLIVSCFNTSACHSFSYNGVYYNLQVDTNSSQRQINVWDGKYIYNFCEQVEYYCESTYQVLTGTLIYVKSNECEAYRQKQINLNQNNNIQSGIKVQFEGQASSKLEILFKCQQDHENQQNRIGCPRVEDSIIFDYLQKQELPFTISAEIFGILLMILGVYIYRFSIVLIAGFSLFTVFLFIQQSVIFYPGMPDYLLNNVVIITVLCSFFGGYVAAYFPKVGIFVLGAWVGIIISLSLNNVAFYFIESSPANLTLWIVLPILALLFGLISLCVKKTFIIFTTSLIGAYLCLRALSWHLGAFPNQFLYPRSYQLDLQGPVEWPFYLYIVALIVLTASSSALQFWLFKKKLAKEGKSGIDSHFQKIQEDLKAKRQNFAEFKNIFDAKDNMDINPKRLKKHESESGSDYDVSEIQMQQSYHSHSSQSSNNRKKL